MTRNINTQNEKQRQLQDLISLNKDPELAIFKAIKAVDKAVDNLRQEVLETTSEAFAGIPEQIPTDMQPMCDKMDAMIAKMEEPMVVKVKLV